VVDDLDDDRELALRRALIDENDPADLDETLEVGGSLNRLGQGRTQGGIVRTLDWGIRKTAGCSVADRLGAAAWHGRGDGDGTDSGSRSSRSPWTAAMSASSTGRMRAGRGR
jgi:hypothetical protein